jgi:hypothetical protein
MITFVRNIQFTRLLKVEGRLKEFNFRKPNNRQESLFTVDTAEEYGSRIIFHMQKNNTSWTIVTRELPQWIIEKESEFSEVIERALNNPDENAY